MLIPDIETLNNPALLAQAAILQPRGKLAISANGLVYVDIDDDFIHKLFPLFNNPEITMPTYFRAGSAGAHISVIYPEEKKLLTLAEINNTYGFSIRKAFSALIGAKRYYGLLVAAPELVALRRKYGLTDKLCFKGYEIGFHITVGVVV